MSVFAGPRTSRSSVHYPEQPAYHASSRGAPSAVYNDSRSEVRDPRIPRSSSRRHSVSSQPRPIIVPVARDRSPQPPSGGRSSVDRFGGGPRSSVDRFGGPPPRSSVDFGRQGHSPPGRQGHSPPGRRNSIHISDSAGGPRNSSASLRRHDVDREEHRGERTRPGTTKFPRKFVNRDAVEEAGWPFEEDRETGAILVFKALSKKEIDALVERTSHIRSLRASSGRRLSQAHQHGSGPQYHPHPQAPPHHSGPPHGGSGQTRGILTRKNDHHSSNRRPAEGDFSSSTRRH